MIKFQMSAILGSYKVIVRPQCFQDTPPDLAIPVRGKRRAKNIWTKKGGYAQSPENFYFLLKPLVTE